MSTHAERLVVEKQVIMGNRRIDVQSRGREHLEFALALARNGMPFTHYVEDEGQLVLCWGSSAGALTTTPLLYPLETTEEVADFVWGWLQNKAEYRERYEGGEVQNEKGGFRLWTNEWGDDAKFSYGFARIEARFAWIGK